MTRWLLAALLVGLIGTSGGASAQVDVPAAPADDDPAGIDDVVRQLFRDIAALSDYRPGALPSVFQVPQHVLEAKVCDAPCNVRAAYIPRDGVYLAGNLDPVHEPLDRAALLHELVHTLQQGHPKFAALSGCARERAKEEEAYALQNAYLAALGRRERVVFYDGAFDCDSGGTVRSP